MNSDPPINAGGWDPWLYFAEILDREGLAALEKGHYRAAELFLREARKVYDARKEEERSHSVAQYLGVTLYEQGKYDEAVSIWEKILSRGYFRPAACGLLLMHYEKSGDQKRLRELSKLLRESRYPDTEIERSRVGQDGAVPASATRSGSSEPRTSGNEATRVLVADNEPEVLDALRRLLDRLGYDVETAADGEAALDAIFRYRPHLALLDVYMPKQSGLDVLYRLRAEGMSIPVIIMSGVAEAELVRNSQVLDARFFAKPIRPEELATVLKDILG